MHVRTHQSIDRRSIGRGWELPASYWEARVERGRRAGGPLGFTRRRPGASRKEITPPAAPCRRGRALLEPAAALSPRVVGRAPRRVLQGRRGSRARRGAGTASRPRERWWPSDSAPPASESAERRVSGRLSERPRLGWRLPRSCCRRSSPGPSLQPMRKFSPCRPSRAGSAPREKRALGGVAALVARPPQRPRPAPPPPREQRAMLPRRRNSACVGPAGRSPSAGARPLLRGAAAVARELFIARASASVYLLVRKQPTKPEPRIRPFPPRVPSPLGPTTAKRASGRTGPRTV